MRRSLLIGCISAAMTVALLALIRPSSEAESNVDKSGAALVDMPFDAVYGLGINRDALERDDQVAAFEAWMRELGVSRCMAAKGHDYAAELLYPVETLTHARVRPPSVGIAPEVPSAKNRQYVAKLTRQDHDTYVEDLFGESLASMELLAETGQIPAGRDGDSFARGGCKGAATKQEPSIWDLKKKHRDELLEMRIEVRKGPALDLVRSEFRACARRQGVSTVSSLPELEPAAVEKRISLEQMEAVSNACTDLWLVGERRALAMAQQLFIERHSAEISAVNDRGASLEEASRNDQAFADVVWASLNNAR